MPEQRDQQDDRSGTPSSHSNAPLVKSMLSPPQRWRPNAGRFKRFPVPGRQPHGAHIATIDVQKRSASDSNSFPKNESESRKSAPMKS
jgi:hypothetical protein